MRARRRWPHSASAFTLCLTTALGLTLLVARVWNGESRAQLFLQLTRGGAQSSHQVSRLCGVARQDKDRGRGCRLQLQAEGEDWREFRARLVQQEKQEKQEEKGEAAPLSWQAPQEEQGAKEEGEPLEGWAHETPLIEQGSLLLSAAGDHFALNQQYFHKCVILIIQHDDNGDIGLILNRPTAFTTDDLDLSQQNFLQPIEGTRAIELNAPQGIRAPWEGEPWTVWCGGDCQGINDRIGSQVPFVLHTSPSLEEYSRQVIKGVYLIDLKVARDLVATKKAERDDFMLLTGYCGWGKGQMQGELDRQDTWALAAADQRTILADLRKLQAETRARINAARAEREVSASEVPLGATDVGNGLQEWERLYVGLGPEFAERLEGVRTSGDDEHTDEMLNRWIQRCLIPPSMSTTKAFSVAAAEVRKQDFKNLKGGTILRASPTAWILGKPAESEEFDLRRFRPSQYLHKGVLLLLRNLTEGEMSVLVLLNGPVVARTKDDAGEILMGGLQKLGEGQILQLTQGDSPLRVEGVEAYRPGVLEKLLSLNALQVAEGVDLQSIVAAPKESRWKAAGGRLETLHESFSAMLGDVQKRKWYKRFLDLDIDAGA